MDEINKKTSLDEDELEETAGGIFLHKPYLRCEKCGREISAYDADKYSEYYDGHKRTHKGCGGLLEPIFKL